MNITVKDIESTTGLDYFYILKAVKEIPEIFDETVITRGNNNSVLFTSDKAYTYFDKIKQLKDAGQSIKSIRSYILEVLNQNNKSESKVEQDDNQNQITKILIDKLEQANLKAFEAFEETIRSKNETIKSLESKILLITDGKSIEELKLTEEQKQNKLLVLEKEVLKKDYEKRELMNKSDQLHQQLNDKDSELEQFKHRLIKRENKELELKKLQSELVECINQLNMLDAKWFVSKQKQTIKKQIDEINQKISLLI